jgi:phenolic acid decarboxylase
MKLRLSAILIGALFIVNNSFAESRDTLPAKNTAYKTTVKNMYIDVHHLEPGKVTAEDVAKAHKKDLAVQKRHGVSFEQYWVDEDKGIVYCLASASNPDSIRHSHAEAHGLIPQEIYQVSEGTAAKLRGSKPFWLDVHELGAGNVTAQAVADAHKKDLAVQKKYGVNLINYWVDEKQGLVFCLAQANDSTDLIKTHKEAHGLLPTYVSKVKAGN